MNVDGLELHLDSTGRIRPKSDDLLGRLRWLVDAHLSGDMPSLVESIERREPRDDGALFAYAVESDQDLSSARERWRHRTGTELGEDVYCLALRWRGPDFYLPRQVLLKVLRTIDAAGREGQRCKR